jgi:hypothetical protein
MPNEMVTKKGGIEIPEGASIAGNMLGSQNINAPYGMSPGSMMDAWGNMSNTLNGMRKLTSVLANSGGQIPVAINQSHQFSTQLASQVGEPIAQASVDTSTRTAEYMAKLYTQRMGAQDRKTTKRTDNSPEMAAIGSGAGTLMGAMMPGPSTPTPIDTGGVAGANAISNPPTVTNSVGPYKDITPKVNMTPTGVDNNNMLRPASLGVQTYSGGG